MSSWAVVSSFNDDNFGIKERLHIAPVEVAQVEAALRNSFEVVAAEFCLCLSCDFKAIELAANLEGHKVSVLPKRCLCVGSGSLYQKDKAEHY